MPLAAGFPPGFCFSSFAISNPCDSAAWTNADIVAPANSPQTILVKGSHIYSTPGTYPIVVYAQGADGTSTSGETVRVTVSQMPSGIPGTPPNPVVTSLAPSNVRVDLSSEPGFSAKAGVNTGTQRIASLSGYINGQQDPNISDSTLRSTGATVVIGSRGMW